MKDIYKLDAQGYYVDVIKIDKEISIYYSDTFEWVEIDFDWVAEQPPIKIMCRPRWNGEAWEDGATPEEIVEWQEQNKLQEPQSSSQEIFNEQLLLENAELKDAVQTLLLDMALLKGGEAVV